MSLLAGSKVHLSPTTWLRANLEGLGIGSIGFDWATISSYLMSPPTSPWFGTVKIAIGFFLIRYTMIHKWLNVYSDKNFLPYLKSLLMSNIPGMTSQVSSCLSFILPRKLLKDWASVSQHLHCYELWSWIGHTFCYHCPCHTLQWKVNHHLIWE